METTQVTGTARRHMGWAGIVFAVLYVVGVLMASSQPETDDINDNPVRLTKAFRDYYSDSGHRTTIIIGAFVLLAATLAFIVFASELRNRLADAGAANTGRLAFAGSIMFAAVTAAGAIALVWIPGTKEFGDFAVPVGDINYMAAQLGFGLVLLAGGAAAALTLVSSGLGAARRGALPKWLAWAGVVIGVLVFFIGGLFIPMALFVLWVLVTAIVMLARTP
jgi:hypothetical protein